MSKKTDITKNSESTYLKQQQLRLEAENRINDLDLTTSNLMGELTNIEYKEILHELTVHQIELQMQNDELQKIQEVLEASELRYYDLFDLAPVGYVIVSTNGAIVQVNQTAIKILGGQESLVLDHKITDYILKEDQDIYYLFIKGLGKSEYDDTSELRVKKSDGEIIWVTLQVNVLQDDTSRLRMIINDITEKKTLAHALESSEKKYRRVYEKMDQGLALFEVVKDKRGLPMDYIFTDINREFTNIFQITEEDCHGKSVNCIRSDIRQPWKQHLDEAFRLEVPIENEEEDEATNRHFATSYFKTSDHQCAILVSDITLRVERELIIEHMSYHDQLTGLYNRRFYEEEVKRLDTARNLPLTILMGDINGLKLINDSFGHKSGDDLLKKVASVFKEVCREDDIVSRVGGDEFIMLLPITDSNEAERVVARIRGVIKNQKIESINVSISFGHETKTDVKQDIVGILKSAENNMYQHKLYESDSIKSKMIEMIMKTLFEKNSRELLHSERVSEICVKLAMAMKLPEDVISQIKLAGLMHDIGKIGIAESVLNSPGKLNDHEWKEIQRHSEIGYRILSTSIDFADIADIVLEHHERWDGHGYPKGLAGLEISLPGRMIMIADTYDAMTRERTYKATRTKDDAKNELLKYSGKQFDPDLVKIFLDEVFEDLC